MKGHTTYADVVRLAPGLEVLSGPNGVPLLYVGERRTYVRLSDTAARVVRWLEGRSVTPAAVSDYLGQQHPVHDEAIDASVGRFLNELDQVGALARDSRGGAPAPRAPWYRTATRYLSRSPRLRLLAWRIDRQIAPRTMAAIRRHAGAAAVPALVVGAMVALMAIANTGLRSEPVACPATVPLWLFATALGIHTVLHELAHALAASYFGVKVREFGIGLLYYFIPVAYTDRTDSYRLTNVTSRAAIALAGPAFDLAAAGVSAVAAALTADSWSSDVQLLSAHLRLLMWLQLTIFLANLNPLLPTDGYQAIEAWWGGLNFQRRAFSLLFRRLTFRSLPPNLQGLRPGEQRTHLMYAALSLAYVGLVAGIVIFQIAHNVAAKMGA